MIAIDRLGLGSRRGRVDVTCTLTPGLTFVVAAPAVADAFIASVAGLPPARRGTVVIEGEPVNGTRPEVALVTREAPLLGSRVRDHLRFVCEWRGGEGAAQAEATLRTWGAGHLLDRAPETLSRAERKRVRFAELASTRPRVTLVAAPFEGLGPEDTERGSQLLTSDAGDRAFIVTEVFGGAAHELAARAALEAMAAGFDRVPSVVSIDAEGCAYGPFAGGRHPSAVRVVTPEADRLAAALEGASGIANVLVEGSVATVWGTARGPVARSILAACREHHIEVGALQ